MSDRRNAAFALSYAKDIMVALIHQSPALPEITIEDQFKNIEPALFRLAGHMEVWLERKTCPASSTPPNAVDITTPSEK